MLSWVNIHIEQNNRRWTNFKLEACYEMGTSWQEIALLNSTQACIISSRATSRNCASATKLCKDGASARTATNAKNCKGFGTNIWILEHTRLTAGNHWAFGFMIFAPSDLAASRACSNLEKTEANASASNPGVFLALEFDQYDISVSENVSIYSSFWGATSPSRGNGVDSKHHMSGETVLLYHIHPPFSCNLIMFKLSVLLTQDWGLQPFVGQRWCVWFEDCAKRLRYVGWQEQPASIISQRKCRRSKLSRFLQMYISMNCA